MIKCPNGLYGAHEWVEEGYTGYVTKQDKRKHTSYQVQITKIKCKACEATKTIQTKDLQYYGVKQTPPKLTLDQLPTQGKRPSK